MVGIIQNGQDDRIFRIIQNGQDDRIFRIDKIFFDERRNMIALRLCASARKCIVNSGL